jgi:hypothetical protein
MIFRKLMATGLLAGMLTIGIAQSMAVMQPRVPAAIQRSVERKDDHVASLFSSAGK